MRKVLANRPLTSLQKSLEMPLRSILKAFERCLLTECGHYAWKSNETTEQLQQTDMHAFRFCGCERAGEVVGGGVVGGVFSHIVAARGLGEW